MSIVTKLEGDDLKINIVDLLCSLSGEQEQQLIEQLSCSESVIKHVADQIIHGCTSEGYSGFIGSANNCSTSLDIAVRAISKASGDIAAKEISSLERSLKSSEETKNEFMQKYYDLKNGVRNNDY